MDIRPLPRQKVLVHVPDHQKQKGRPYGHLDETLPGGHDAAAGYIAVIGMRSPILDRDLAGVIAGVPHAEDILRQAHTIADLLLVIPLPYPVPIGIEIRLPDLGLVPFVVIGFRGAVLDQLTAYLPDIQVLPGLFQRIAHHKGNDSCQDCHEAFVWFGIFHFYSLSE